MPSEDGSMPPLPASPQDEEDLARAHRWHDDEEERLDPSNNKAGKGKAREVYPEEDDVSAHSTGSTINRYPDEEEGEEEYPPVTEDEAETRRIEEVLTITAFLRNSTKFEFHRRT
jgi:hypothetical protein